jgi:hypothetical protein
VIFRFRANLWQRNESLGVAVTGAQDGRGVSYFQSGLETVVWSSPRSGYVDFTDRRIIAHNSTFVNLPGGITNYTSRLSIYDLDSEAQTDIVPAAGSLPLGTFVSYTESQALWSAGNMLLIVDLMVWTRLD